MEKYGMAGTPFEHPSNPWYWVNGTQMEQQKRERERTFYNNTAVWTAWYGAKKKKSHKFGFSHNYSFYFVLEM